MESIIRTLTEHNICLLNKNAKLQEENRKKDDYIKQLLSSNNKLRQDLKSKELQLNV